MLIFDVQFNCWNIILSAVLISLKTADQTLDLVHECLQLKSESEEFDSPNEERHILFQVNEFHVVDQNWRAGTE